VGNRQRNIALRDALRPIAERHGVTVSAIAAGWLDLDASDLAQITGAVRRLGTLPTVLEGSRLNGGQDSR
jgi:hypothetical protein